MKHCALPAILAWVTAWSIGALQSVHADDLRDRLTSEVRMYRVATGEFAPVYPALARQILEDYGIRQGVCVDIGGGTGHLAMALVRQSELKAYNLDIDPKAIRLSGILVDEAGLTGRVIPIEGDAQDMPFRDNFADLVVSRGSIPFWPDRVQGIRECYRILKPGGVAFIGGGFSRILDPKVRTPIAKASAAKFAEKPPEGFRRPDDLDDVARQAGIPETQWRFLRESIIGWWLEIRKPAVQ